MDAYQAALAYIHILEAELSECHDRLYSPLNGYKYDYEYDIDVEHPCVECFTAKYLYVSRCADCDELYITCRGCNDALFRSCGQCSAEIWYCRAHKDTWTGIPCAHCQRPVWLCDVCTKDPNVYCSDCRIVHDPLSASSASMEN
jgi:hypothetical protein